MAAATAPAVKEVKESKQPKPLPPPNSDFSQLADVLTADERAGVKKVRTYTETHVTPIINKYWSDEAFPFELLETRDRESTGSRARIKPSRSSSGGETSAVRVGFLLCGWTFRAARQSRQRPAHGTGA